jgi:hypothetical protein
VRTPTTTAAGGGTGTLTVTMSADLQSFDGEIEATSGADAGQHGAPRAPRSKRTRFVARTVKGC